MKSWTIAGLKGISCSVSVPKALLSLPVGLWHFFGRQLVTSQLQLQIGGINVNRDLTQRTELTSHQHLWNPTREYLKVAAEPQTNSESDEWKS